ncbi:MAG: hypothetical protein QOK43_479 [Acidimicrobiaceae bacterium]|nr:hypothetical protein [Acidimicrobiaceae bacterium]
MAIKDTGEGARVEAAVKAAAAAAAEDAKARFELAQLAYKEVLDATKHQDDKVGRFLSAIAFLTGAAIAFATRKEILEIKYDVGGKIALPAGLFLVFVVLVLVAVTVFLFGMGQTLRLPGASSPGKTPLARSRLFFMSIADKPRDDWEAMWSDDIDVTRLRSEMTSNLVIETHNLAVRADQKYQRSGEAQAVFTISLVAFGLGFVLALRAETTDVGRVIPWNLTSRALATFVIAGFTGVLGYGWGRYEQSFTERTTTRYKWLRVLPLVTTIYVSALVLPPDNVDSRTRMLLAGAGFVTMFAVGWTIAVRWTAKKSRRLMMLPTMAAAAFSAYVVWNEWVRWRLALAVSTVVIMELPRLLASTSTWHRRFAAATTTGAAASHP